MCAISVEEAGRVAEHVGSKMKQVQRIGIMDEDDVRQEIRVQVFYNLVTRYDPSRAGSPLTYAWLIAKRTINHCTRQRKRGGATVYAPTAATTVLPDSLFDPIQERISDDSVDIEQEIIDHELVAGALAQLPERLRPYLQMRVDGVNYREIAVALGVTKEVVGNRIAEAKRLVMRYIIKALVEEEEV